MHPTLATNLFGNVCFAKSPEKFNSIFGASFVEQFYIFIYSYIYILESRIDVRPENSRKTQLTGRGADISWEGGKFV